MKCNHTMIDELAAYRLLYNRIKKRINDGDYTFVFPVPVKMIICPDYHLTKCIIFLIKKIRQDKIQVLYKHPNLLVITNTTKKQNNPTSPIRSNLITDSSVVNIISNVEKYTV